MSMLGLGDVQLKYYQLMLLLTWCSHVQEVQSLKLWGRFYDYYNVKSDYQK